MYSYTLSLTSTLDGGGWSTPRSGRFILRKDTLPTVPEAGWPLGPVWTGMGNLAPPTGIRSPDSPARSESLYRLSYRGPYTSGKRQIKFNWEAFISYLHPRNLYFSFPQLSPFHRKSELRDVKTVNLVPFSPFRWHCFKHNVANSVSASKLHVLVQTATECESPNEISCLLFTNSLLTIWDIRSTNIYLTLLKKNLIRRQNYQVEHKTTLWSVTT